MDYRYHVGDKVLVKSDLHEVGFTAPDSELYRMRSGPQEHGWVSCRKSNLQFAGKVVTIKTCDGGYHIEEAEDLWFVDDMFEGLANENECVCNS